MSEPQVGQMVWWYPGGDAAQEPFAAIVTRVGQQSLNVNIFDPYSYNMRIRDNVRHVTDPSNKEEMRDQGGWDWPAWAFPAADKAPAKKG